MHFGQGGATLPFCGVYSRANGSTLACKTLKCRGPGAHCWPSMIGPQHGQNHRTQTARRKPGRRNGQRHARCRNTAARELPDSSSAHSLSPVRGPAAAWTRTEVRDNVIPAQRERHSPRAAHPKL